MRFPSNFHKDHPTECGCFLSYEGCLFEGRHPPGSNLSRRNPSFFRDYFRYPLHNNFPEKNIFVIAQLFCNQIYRQHLCVTPTLILIFRVVFWVTHHIALPLSLYHNFFLVAWNCVWSLEVVEKAEKMWRISKRKTCHTPWTVEVGPF